MVEVGSKAPEFTLPADSWESRVSLGDFLKEGDVALFFYPGDWSSVCTDQLDEIQQHLDEFERRGVRVLAVSTDSPWSHRAWAEARGISFPLLADFNKEVSRSYGVLREQGFPDRAYFVVDRSGVVRARRVEKTPKDRPDLKQVLQDLDAVL
ncbi:redoxin domain-containing protein [Rubrobacter taiwanensis]|jgi:peroxiredoxin|uniref:Redoxin domain-containing protein n=1 Tax=Rubrobacter taiwanensis TaxID=185139 RepID=A0A4R1BJB1_9ACTN|nr:redoxin domain-containing protein [Rubrobacter taiwanensis]TCJ17371.1 redoxin domain-containing protein [Rubrobacter taiwanensis]